MEKLKTAIIGAGRMGRIRALSAMRHPGCEVLMIADSDPEKASVLASELDCAWSTDWEEALARPDLDAVAVCTPHKFLMPIGVAALAGGRHLFCEKPMGRSYEEGRRFAEAAKRAEGETATAAVVGFTLRYHPAVSLAHRLLKQGAIGQPFYIRAAYGHGGRPGYDREWRTDPELGGGGELLDQGVHLIDLSRWFLGEFSEVAGAIGAYFWRGEAESAGSRQESFAAVPGSIAEDNAFLLLRTSQGQTASLHASWTQWKNCFSFEIFGADGSISVYGLGGSYGPEKLVQTRRNPMGGVPDVSIEEFDGTADVWDREWAGFAAVARSGTPTASEASESATVFDGCEVLRIAQQIYDVTQKNRAQRAAIV